MEAKERPNGSQDRLLDSQGSSKTIEKPWKINIFESDPWKLLEIAKIVSREVRGTPREPKGKLKGSEREAR